MTKVQWTLNAAEDIAYWKKYDVKKYERIKLLVKNVSLLTKLAIEEQVQGAHGAQNRSVVNLHEDLSTGVTTQLLSRVELGMEAIQESPFMGIGKPEPLKHSLSGLWSRRINHEHRLIYSVKSEQIIIYNCRFHYTKNT